MDRFTAFLDANVIYPAGLRDTLLRLADRLFATTGLLCDGDRVPPKSILKRMKGWA
ncbi:MAG: hypothetical protein AAFQ65_12850 [Myxococcota bacterium]